MYRSVTRMKGLVDDQDNPFSVTYYPLPMTRANLLSSSQPNLPNSTLRSLSLHLRLLIVQSGFCPLYSLILFLPTPLHFLCSLYVHVIYFLFSTTVPFPAHRLCPSDS